MILSKARFAMDWSPPQMLDSFSLTLLKALGMTSRIQLTTGVMTFLMPFQTLEITFLTAVITVVMIFFQALK